MAARLSTRARVATAIAAAVTLTGAVLIALGYLHARELVVWTHLEARLRTESELLARELRSWVGQQEERVALVASRTRLRRLIDMRAEGEIHEEAFVAQSSKILRDAVSSSFPKPGAESRSAGRFLSIAIGDEAGRVLTAADPARAGLPIHAAAGSDYEGGVAIGRPRWVEGEWISDVTGTLVTPAGRRRSLFVRIAATRVVEALRPPDLHVHLGRVRGGEAELFVIPRGQPAGATTPAGWFRSIGFIPDAGVDDTDATVSAYVRPLDYAGWVLRVTLPVEQALAPLETLRSAALGLLALVVLGALAAASALARRISQPLRDLTAAAQRVAEGDLDVDVAIPSEPELGALAEVFNAMVAAARNRHLALEDAVNARTRELETANAALETARAVAEASATVDLLTQLPNRRCLDQALKDADARFLRGQPVSIVLIDVDHFKAVNDAHGHQVGNLVLRAVADVLQAEARGADMVARYGGEEFVALVFDEHPRAGTDYAERARAALEHANIEGLAITASFGVAALGKDARGVESAMRAADRALYTAKRRGRNCVFEAGNVGLSRAA